MAVVKTLIGNIKGPKGEKGDKGDTGAKGDKGATGQRGSRWTQGTKITGTSTTATIFSSSGISDALVNDNYLNTSTGNTYRCTVAGDASTAKWVYSGNIKGPKGDTGAKGDKGDAGETGPRGPQGEYAEVDSTLSKTSTNPIQNKTVAEELEKKINSDGDSKDLTTTFTSGDSTNVTEWTEVGLLTSGEKHSSLFQKIATMFKNIRYLYHMLGTADISTLGEGANIGTVTGAISKLNSELLNMNHLNGKQILYTPSNTGCTSLLDFVLNYIFNNSDISYCTFGASGFDDLPWNNWGFSIECHSNVGGRYVIAYRIISNNDIYVRGISYELNWLDDWKQISFL